MANWRTSRYNLQINRKSEFTKFGTNFGNKRKSDSERRNPLMSHVTHIVSLSSQKPPPTIPSLPPPPLATFAHLTKWQAVCDLLPIDPPTPPRWPLLPILPSDKPCPLTPVTLPPTPPPPATSAHLTKWQAVRDLLPNDPPTPPAGHFCPSYQVTSRVHSPPSPSPPPPPRWPLLPILPSDKPYVTSSRSMMPFMSSSWPLTRRPRIHPT